MDSKAILDYALFQLTPTRTRCELIVFSGGVREKIASGLFEPFVSHLKFVKDEICKGGYSIKMLPPTTGALWFSKATFERFVRFVSTPAILERFVTIEKETLQIESSYQANALSISSATSDEAGTMPQANGIARRLSDSAKLNGVLEEVDNKEEENSKISLQRLLESRIALLRKEQAMAYTRGLVAGFEIDNIDDLIYFANAFGAFRLREACINFKDLWKKKHADDLWIKEVAAMQSCLPPAISFSGTSGIVLANDIIAHDQMSENNSSKDSNSAGDQTANSKEDVNLSTPDQKPSHTANVHMPMPWPYNVPPPYMYNLQNPIQQMPPYQGYPMANMQPVPPHLLRNMQWSSDMGVNQKPSATKKKKSPHKKGQEEYEDQQTESSDPDSASESDSDEQQDSNHSLKDEQKRKKHRRKSNGTVVIRNINYITPKRRNGNEDEVSDESSLDDDDAIDEETIKQKVGAALESFQKVHKGERRANGKKVASRRNGTKSSDATEEDLTENLGHASEEGNKNDNWDVFQNLLKIDEDTGVNGSERAQPIDVQDEHFVARNFEEGKSYASSAPHLDFKEVRKNPNVPSDSFIVANRDGGNEDGSKLGEYVDSRGPVSKRRDSVGEEILLSHRQNEQGNELGDPLSTFVADSSVTKTKTRADDWFIVDNLEKKRSSDPQIVSTVFDGDYTMSSVNDSAEKRSQRTLIDDSFMIQGQLVNDNLFDSQWKTDISMVDLSSASKLESDAAASNQKQAPSKNQEPSDLFVVLQRDSRLDSVEATRTMDYEIDFSFSETVRRSSIDDSQDTANKETPVSPENEKTTMNKSKVSGTKSSEKEKSKGLRGSFQKGKPEIVPRNRRQSLPSRPIVHKSKREQEDEIRKRTEELLLERQRRIAERTASSGLVRASPRKDQVSAKTEKNSKTQSVKETNRIGSAKVRGI